MVNTTPTSQIKLVEVGHYYVTFAFGLNANPGGSAGVMALEISTNNGGSWSIYNLYSVLTNSSTPIHAMSLTVTTTVPNSLIRITNYTGTTLVLGLGGTVIPATLGVSQSQCPYTYINVTQVD